MSLQKVDLNAVAETLKRPFLLEAVAQIDHFSAYLYHCEGIVSRHSHLGQDELFYVHSGMLSLDTDWGRVTLSKGEFALVPAGLAHVSGALTRTIVLLFQARSDMERKNGHGKLIVERRSDALPKWSLAQEAGRLRRPFSPEPLTQVDEMSLRVIWCQGETPWHIHPDHDEMLCVISGRLEIGSDLGPITLEPDQLLVIPRNRIHRLTSGQRTIVLSLIHKEVDSHVQMGG